MFTGMSALCILTTHLFLSSARYFLAFICCTLSMVQFCSCNNFHIFYLRTTVTPLAFIIPRIIALTTHLAPPPHTHTLHCRIIHVFSIHLLPPLSSLRLRTPASRLSTSSIRTAPPPYLIYYWHYLYLPLLLLPIEFRCQLLVIVL